MEPQQSIDILTPVLFAAGGLLAGLYLLRVSQPPGQARTLIKTLSVVALALAALFGGGPILLVLALALCAVGDAFLAQKSETALRAGMAAFGAGHLVYIILFVNAGGGVGWDWIRILLQLLVLGAAVQLVRWLWPDLGAMRNPVAAYCVVIGLMALLSLGLPTSLWVVTVGALLFLTSDALIAGELFKLPEDSPTRRWSAPAVWSLYWLGQAAITAGFLYPAR